MYAISCLWIYPDASVVHASGSSRARGVDPGTADQPKNWWPTILWESGKGILSLKDNKTAVSDNIPAELLLLARLINRQDVVFVE